MIENIHTIIAAAAVKFSSDQLNHLFVLIQKVGFNLNLYSLGELVKKYLCIQPIKRQVPYMCLCFLYKCKVKCICMLFRKKGGHRTLAI